MFELACQMQGSSSFGISYTRRCTFCQKGHNNLLIAIPASSENTSTSYSENSNYFYMKYLCNKVSCIRPLFKSISSGHCSRVLVNLLWSYMGQMANRNSSPNLSNKSPSLLGWTLSFLLPFIGIELPVEIPILSCKTKLKLNDTLGWERIFQSFPFPFSVQLKLGEFDPQWTNSRTKSMILRYELDLSL